MKTPLWRDSATEGSRELDPRPQKAAREMERTPQKVAQKYSKPQGAGGKVIREAPAEEEACYFRMNLVLWR